jgi:hypothetical protein
LELSLKLTLKVFGNWPVTLIWSNDEQELAKVANFETLSFFLITNSSRLAPDTVSAVVIQERASTDHADLGVTFSFSATTWS